ncbi:MAG: DUF4136 domain-containing protein [Bryobacteraceae bacterium]|jgi:hypothetical protein
MKATFLLFAPALLTMAGMACAADVSVDYDHHADFSQIHTYSWIGIRAGDSLWQDRIMRAVDNELQAKGWQKVESGGDAGVSAFGRTAERENMETFYDGFPGWRWRGWGGMATTTVVPERVGTLTVDVFLGNSKELIFRGTGSDVLSSKPEKNDKKLDETVGKMFKHFPPAGKD